MPNTSNKVKYNLKNVHYALLSFTNGEAVYGTPIPIPGAVSLSLDDNGVLIENSNAQLNPFALLFEFDGDKKQVRHVLYNCSASRPGIEGKTNEESKEVQTETLTLKATPLSDGLVKAKTGNSTTAETYASWYSAVYMPTEEDDA